MFSEDFVSWDVVIMRAPQNVTTIDEMPHEESPPLGSLSDVLDSLRSLFSAMNLSDPTWGILDGPDFSIEFNIGNDDPVSTIMLHVRGSEAALGPIQLLCRNMGCKALDTSEGDFIDFSGDAAAGLRDWQAFVIK